jgi:putative aminopeptidase FrvX
MPVDKHIAFLKELTEAPGPPGHEGPARQVMASRLATFCALDSDRLGSLIARKEGAEDGPKVMLSAHMDEVGFLVKRVTEQGYLKFTNLGGWWPQRLIGHRVTVLTKQGPIPGLIECKTEHRMTEEERKRIVPLEELFIDVGARDADQGQTWGIRPGTTVVPATRFTVMADESLYLAKAWDDRAGCGVAVDVLLALTEMTHPNTVYTVGTVQEEVGARGAQTAGTAIKPDVGLVLEIAVATDTPGLSADEIVPIALGKGPAVTVHDPSMVPNPKLVELVLKVAEEEDIPIQYSVVPSGGTDGTRIHLLETGVPCLVLGVPTRYIHSMASLIDRHDYDHLVRLVAATVVYLDEATVRGFAHS